MCLCGMPNIRATIKLICNLAFYYHVYGTALGGKGKGMQWEERGGQFSGTFSGQLEGVL